MRLMNDKLIADIGEQFDCMVAWKIVHTAVIGGLTVKLVLLTDGAGRLWLYGWDCENGFTGSPFANGKEWREFIAEWKSEIAETV